MSPNAEAFTSVAGFSGRESRGVGGTSACAPKRSATGCARTLKLPPRSLTHRSPRSVLRTRALGLSLAGAPPPAASAASAAGDFQFPRCFTVGEFYARVSASRLSVMSADRLISGGAEGEWVSEGTQPPSVAAMGHQSRAQCRGDAGAKKKSGGVLRRLTNLLGRSLGSRTGMSTAGMKAFEVQPQMQTQTEGQVQNHDKSSHLLASTPTATTPTGAGHLPGGRVPELFMEVEFGLQNGRDPLADVSFGGEALQLLLQSHLTHAESEPESPRSTKISFGNTNSSRFARDISPLSSARSESPASTRAKQTSRAAMPNKKPTSSQTTASGLSVAIVHNRQHRLSTPQCPHLEALVAPQSRRASRKRSEGDPSRETSVTPLEDTYWELLPGDLSTAASRLHTPAPSPVSIARTPSRAPLAVLAERCRPLLFSQESVESEYAIAAARETFPPTSLPLSALPAAAPVLHGIASNATARGAHCCKSSRSPSLSIEDALAHCRDSSRSPSLTIDETLALSFAIGIKPPCPCPGGSVGVYEAGRTAKHSEGSAPSRHLLMQSS